MKIVYCGHFLNNNLIGTFAGPAISANRMNLGLIEKLIDLYPEMDLLSLLPISAYPNEKLMIDKQRIPLFDEKEKLYTQISFINLPYIKAISASRSLGKELEKTQGDLIINYNPYYELQIPTIRYCKRHKKKAICIIADIPVTIPKNFSPIKKLLRHYEIWEYYRAIRKYDGVIVLNKQVISEFGLECPYYLMDGGVSDEEIRNSFICPDEKRNFNRIVYTGALESYNGIMELIDGFVLTKTRDLELVICGSGTLEEEIKNKIKNMTNIVYMGRIPNEEAKKLQREAGLLISTRPIDRFALKLTFPSKIIEYLLSGTPVLTTKLNGLADSYDKYVYYCGQSVSDIAEAIDRFFTIPVVERQRKAELAREFVIKNKNYEMHCLGIRKLIEEVYK